MESDSDGSKPAMKGKNVTVTRKASKTRSNSLGNLNLSTVEIKRIIGAADNNKPAISTETKTEGKQTEEPLLRGQTEKYKGEILGIKTDEDSVFKPKRSVQRTPPTSKMVVENKNKRPRSEWSPENNTDMTQKQLRGKTDSSSQTEHCQEANVENVISEKKIAEFYSALDIFSDAIKKEKNEISQTSLRKAHSEICKIFTILVLKQGQIEKENIHLQSLLYTTTQAETINSLEDTSQQYQKENMTYAKIANYTKKSNLKSQESDIEQVEQQWKTPKTLKKFETIINVQNVSDPKEAMKKFKQNINVKEVGGSLKNIKQTKSGTIIVESHSKEQQNKLQTAIKSIDYIKAKENPINDPMFMITGIEKGYSEKEFVEELIRLNDEIEAELQTNVADKIRVIGRKQCRNPNKENWILQAPPDVSKWFLKKGTVYFDLVSVYVQEHLNLAMCFKCSGFDHVAKYCTEKECCHKCSEEHKASECTESMLRCPNCSKMKLNDTNHSARDAKNCPTYQTRLLRYKNSINYSGDFP